MAPPRGAMGLSAVCDYVFSDNTHLLFFKMRPIHPLSLFAKTASLM